MCNQYNKDLYILDNHCHIFFPESIETVLQEYKKVIERCNIKEAGFLSCPAASHHESGMAIMENLEVLYIKDRLGIPVYAYASYIEHYDDPQRYSEFANEMLEMGFDGFKSMEQHPKDRRDLGKGLSHPSFASFFDVLDKRCIPMVCHVGEPRHNWDLNTADAVALQLGRVYGKDCLTLDELYMEMEEVVAKYKNIPFVMAHFYFISDNYDRACKLVDLTPGGEMFVNFSKHPQLWRDFFIKYRKRILMGSDHYAQGSGMHRFDLARNFLEGTEPLEYGGDPIYPIHLPEDVLEDIYCNNAKRLLGNEPKSINRQKVYQHCLYIQNNFMDKLTEIGKENLRIITAYFEN